MKAHHLATVLFIAVIGCNDEPTTLRGQAEQAQEDLEEARVQAAELVAESEEDAVEIVADAREEAQEEVLDAKREADRIVAGAKEELNEKMEELSQPGTVESKPKDDPQPISP